MHDSQSIVERQRHTVSRGQLRDAEGEYDADILARRGGVTTSTLESDLQRWRTLGSAVVELARQVRQGCLASDFCEARPEVEPLAIRLIEAIDDQIDPSVWRVIDAQVRLQAAGARR